MPISVTCESCDFAFKVGSEFAGRRGVCPNPDCRAKYVVPLPRRRVVQPAEGRKQRSTSGQRPRRSSPVRQGERHAQPLTAAVAGKKASPSDRTQPTASRFRRRLILASSVIAASLFMLLVAFAAAPKKAKSQNGSAASSNPSDAKSNSQRTTSPQPAAAVVRVQTDETYNKHVAPFLQKFCVDCHDNQTPEAGIVLNRFPKEADALKERQTWEKVIAMLEKNSMPPEDHDSQPTESERKHVVAWIDSRFFNIDCELVHDPGRVTIRRLNRNEYNNTIRDLVGVDFKPAEDFPSDDVGYGFDNIGDVLSLPPLLMEKYLDAAEAIAEEAIIVGDPSKRLAVRVDAKKLLSKNAESVHGNGFRWMASAGSVFSKFEFPRPGQYVIRAEAIADQAGSELARMEFRVDGKKIAVHEIKGHMRVGMYETTIKIGAGHHFKPGKHVVAAAFINDYYMPKARDPKQRDRNMGVRRLEVQGPLGGDVYPESHSRIVFVLPGEGKSAEDCIRKILTRFATRSFRRPVAPAEIEPVVQFASRAIQDGEEFARGVQLGVQAILVSSHFLFRIENDTDPDNPRRAHKIGQYELATRLSYFLWSSMPDDELFALAEQGVLHRPGVLEAQVRRMLRDPKSVALIENFAGQWLNLRNLDIAAPNPEMFSTFTAELKSDMRRETELFFKAVMQEDRSILDFLDARFTFLNARLAKHYGISGIQGNAFRKVPLTGNRRAGILTHASILTLTSHPRKTSPVKRGKWILENILGTPPPPPPPGVPELAKAQKANPNASLREQLQLHRTNPTCASCHKVMDPLGIGMENFDPIGRWREKDGKFDIDPSGKLPNGDSFNNPVELLTILKKQKDQFSRHLTRTMLTYALGRGLEYYDKCAVDEILKSLEAEDYRFSELVVKIVHSNPFLMRRGDGGQQ